MSTVDLTQAEVELLAAESEHLERLAIGIGIDLSGDRTEIRMSAISSLAVRGLAGVSDDMAEDSAFVLDESVGEVAASIVDTPRWLRAQSADSDGVDLNLLGVDHSGIIRIAMNAPGLGCFRVTTGDAPARERLTEFVEAAFGEPGTAVATVLEGNEQNLTGFSWGRDEDGTEKAIARWVNGERKEFASSDRTAALLESFTDLGL